MIEPGREWQARAVADAADAEATMRSGPDSDYARGVRDILRHQLGDVVNDDTLAAILERYDSLL